MTRRQPDAIDLDDIDITDAFECLIVIDEVEPSDHTAGPYLTCFLLSVDPDGYIKPEDDDETLRQIFNAEQ